MQILLTEEEYNDLKNKAADLSSADRHRNNQLCMRVAQHEPVLKKWKDKDDPDRYSPWGCIHTPCPECGDTQEDMDWCDCELDDDVREEFNRKSAPYCDDCPVQKECTMRHSYSK